MSGFNPYGYPDCCVEAFWSYAERCFDNPDEPRRPHIHCYVPCSPCLERAPLEQLWREIEERRGYGCVDSLLHLVTYVEPNGDGTHDFETGACDDCVRALQNDVDPAETGPTRNARTAIAEGKPIG